MNVGDNLLPLTAPSTAGTFDLAEHKGRWVVFYFYPKDNTSACTLEARTFSSAKDEFAAEGCDIVGISRDTVGVHQGFCKRQDLTIELASDKEEVLCNRFGVIKDTIMYGKPCRGIVRDLSHCPGRDACPRVERREGPGPHRSGACGPQGRQKSREVTRTYFSQQTGKHPSTTPD